MPSRSAASVFRRRLRLAALGVCIPAVGLTSLAAYALAHPDLLREARWLPEPLRVLSVDDLPLVADFDGDRIVRAPSLFERLRATVHDALPRAAATDASAPGIAIAATAPTGPGRRPVASGGGAPSTTHSQPAALITLRSDVSYVDTKAATYTRFKSFVDTAVAGNPDYGFSATDAVVMYQLTRQEKYCTTAVSTVEEQVTAAEAAIARGSAPEVAGDSYLYVGPMIGDLAMTYRVCSLTASQRQRWANYAEQAVWNVWNFASAQWGGKKIPWSGWSVSNPGNNYHYSFLEATMTWALASNSQTWTDFLRTKKLPPLQAYFAKLPGGGSNEGTGYGTSHMSLFWDYLLWRDGTGQDLGNANSHMTDTIRYWVHATVPTLDRFAPIGDQARVSTPDIYDYQRRLMLEARWMSRDDDARAMASWWLTHISILKMTSGFNSRYDLLPAGTNNTAPTELVYWAKGTGHLFARTDWGKTAMWVSFIAGPFNESHAHQEEGGFTLFSGDWLAVTENIWTRSGIQQDTPQHNVLRFERNGSVVPQVNGTTSSMTMTPGTAGAFTATANLKPAYGGNGAIGAWSRKLDFADRTLTVSDSFTLGSGTTATFQVNVPTQPVVSGNLITAGKLRIRVLSPANPTIKLLDWKTMGSSEYLKGWRVDIGGSATAYKVELSDH